MWVGVGGSGHIVVVLLVMLPSCKHATAGSARFMTLHVCRNARKRRSHHRTPPHKVQPHGRCTQVPSPSTTSTISFHPSPFPPLPSFAQNHPPTPHPHPTPRTSKRSSLGLWATRSSSSPRPPPRRWRPRPRPRHRRSRLLTCLKVRPSPLVRMHAPVRACCKRACGGFLMAGCCAHLHAVEQTSTHTPKAGCALALMGWVAHPPLNRRRLVVAAPQAMQ